MAARPAVSGTLALLLLYSTLSVSFGVLPASAAGEDDVPPEMQARAEAVFARIADALAPEHDIHGNYTIQVVREKVPNAWINRSNEIFVSTGLMELLATDDQLAGVIGHEIAHGTLGHIPHRINQSVWTAFAVLALGIAAGSSGSSDWGGLLHMRDLFLFAYSRDQEAEADLVGMQYARAAGYKPEGLVEALLLMDRERRSLPPDSPWHDVYRTHPPIPQRVTELRFVLTTEQVLQAAPASPPLTAEAPASPEDAAVTFARALLSGDAEGARRVLLRTAGAGGPAEGREDAVRTWIQDNTHAVDPAWAASSGEIVAGGGGDAAFGFDATVVVRLMRPAPGGVLEGGAADGPPGDAVVSPELSVTVRRSAAGWFVVAWQWRRDAP